MATIKNVFTSDEIEQLRNSDKLRAEKRSRCIKQFIADNADEAKPISMGIDMVDKPGGNSQPIHKGGKR